MTPDDPSKKSYIVDNCVGGHPDHVLDLLLKQGLPDDTCQSYQGIKEDCSPENICRACPHDGCVAVTPKRYRIREHGEVFGELNMTKEIYARGPIAATIAIPDALEEYRGTRTPPWLRALIHGTSIFNDTTGAFFASVCPFVRLSVSFVVVCFDLAVLVCADIDTVSVAGVVTEDHVIEITGWGVEKGHKYWVVRNSWGTWWGEGGWAKIIRGTNNLGIELQDVYWAVPEMADFP